MINTFHSTLRILPLLNLRFNAGMKNDKDKGGKNRKRKAVVEKKTYR